MSNGKWRKKKLRLPSCAVKRVRLMLQPPNIRTCQHLCANA